MDKKNCKGIPKISACFEAKNKKSKKSFLFSNAGQRKNRYSQQQLLKRASSPRNQNVQSYKNINNQISTTFIQQKPRQKGKMLQSTPGSNHNQTTKKHQNKMGRCEIKTSDPWKKYRFGKLSRERGALSPKPKLFSQTIETKISSDDLLNSKSIQIEICEKQIKRLQVSVERFKKMHQSSQKRLWRISEKAKEDQIKHQRQRKIHLERIKILSRNIRSNQRSLGHLYTYKQMDKNIVPEQIILELSNEQKSRILDPEVLEEYYYQSGNESMISNISINSRSSLAD